MTTTIQSTTGLNKDVLDDNNAGEKLEKVATVEELERWNGTSDGKGAWPNSTPRHARHLFNQLFYIQ